MGAKVAVVLSGCGFMDGAEIHESVLTLYFLERAGASIQMFAPDKDQMHVVNHLTGKPTAEKRNVMVESARIARGNIKEIKEAKMADFDALVVPGGFGVAKNLCDFAIKGADARVDPEVKRLVEEAVSAKKPLVAICIAPALVAAALRGSSTSARLTIGNDPGTASALETMGAGHQNCPVDQAVVDEENRIITTPAYMLGSGPGEVGSGIEQAINKLMTWL